MPRLLKRWDAGVLGVSFIVAGVLFLLEARRQSLKRLLIGTAFCPIRAQYPSYVTDEQAAEIKKRQDAALAIPRWFRRIGVGMLVVGIASAFVVGWQVVTRKKDESHNPRMQTDAAVKGDGGDEGSR